MLIVLLAATAFVAVYPVTTVAANTNIVSTGYLIRVGPNPILDDLNIIINNYSGEFIDSREVRIKMYNTAGNVVLEDFFSTSMLPGEHIYTLSTHNVPSGIYTIRVQVGRSARQIVEFYKIGGNVWGSFEH